MHQRYLYSLILELTSTRAASIPATNGHQAQALFLDLVRQVDPALSARLHDEPGYRPYTVSPLRGARTRDGLLFLQAGQPYHIRITLLDDGQLWQCLSARCLATPSLTLFLDTAEFQLQRVLSTPESDATGWAGHADWQTLASIPARRAITLYFASPCAFSLGDRRYALFPEPRLVWDSLLRTWNLYAPEVLHIEKTALRDFVTNQVAISDYALHTTTLHFPRYIRKGFLGTCSYCIQTSAASANHVATLAAFARYSGIGYKTPMGMGQVRQEDPTASEYHDAPKVREAQV
ncbi:MAG: CRISPR-associated endoribonuclease Cas6 [Ktedonobacteraceae bacterium]